MASGRLRSRSVRHDSSLPLFVITPAESQGTASAEPPQGQDLLLSPSVADVTSPYVQDLERWTPAPEPSFSRERRSNRTHARTGSSGVPQNRSSSPLPSLPQPCGPLEGVQAKLLRYETDVFKPHNWRRWMGINTLKSVSSLPSLRLRSFSNDEPPSIVPTREARAESACSDHPLDTIGVLHRESASLTPTASRTTSHRRSLSIPTTRNPSPDSFPRGQAVSFARPPKSEDQASLGPDETRSQHAGRRSSLSTEDPGAIHAKQVSSLSRRAVPISSAAGKAPLIVQPQPRVPSALLDRRWSGQDSSTSSQGDDTSDTSDPMDNDADESIQTLSLSHCNVLTNKELHASRRKMRKLPAELRDENASRSDSTSAQVVRSSRVRHTPDEVGSSRATTPNRTPSPFMEGGVGTRLRPALRTRQRSTGGSWSDENVAPERESVVTPPASSAGSNRPHMWRRRERRAWNQASVEEEIDDDEQPQPRPVHRSSHVFVSPVQSDTPELVYDMLHENQRGIVLFGVSKRFSSNVLFVWDPSPWTDADGCNTALDTSTMQLPDSTWEWVHPTWLVDMTGNTDEDGWQYSGSFTGLHFWRKPIQSAAKSGPRHWWQTLHKFAQSIDANLMARRESKEASRPDEGMEAFMRSVRSRSEKWTSKPGIWTFVRRRRWVRMRRRIGNAHLSKGLGIPTADGSLVLVSETCATSDNASTNDQVLLGFESAIEDDVDIDEQNLTEKQHLLVAIERLHHLLPFFMIPSSHLAEALPPTQPLMASELEKWSRHFRFILEEETYLQNPFFALGWIQRWLARPDLKDLTRRLRQQERTYQKTYVSSAQRNDRTDQQLMKEKMLQCEQCLSMSTTLSLPTKPTVDVDEFYPHRPSSPFTPSECLLLSSRGCCNVRPSIVRQAVVEHNFAMVMNLMRLCLVDRLRVDLWLMWLHGCLNAPDDSHGAELEGSLSLLQQEWYRRRSMLHDMQRLGRTPAAFSPLIERILRNRIYDYTHSAPILLDVWDILVAHVCTICLLIPDLVSYLHVFLMY